MIIDAHCHAGRSEALTAPWTTGAPLTAYLRRARAAGIDRTVVMPTFPADSRVANAELVRLVARGRGRFIGFAWIHPRRDAGRVADLLDDAVAGGLRGVKVHAHDGAPGRELCDAAAERNLPVLVDVLGRGHLVDLFAGAYPQVTFIVAHLGSFGDDWKAHQTVIDAMSRHRNVYADTSGVRRFDYLVEAVRHVGPHRLVWGSDGPWLHPGLELHKIKLLGLRAADEAGVLGESIRRILARADATRRGPRRRRGPAREAMLHHRRPRRGAGAVDHLRRSRRESALLWERAQRGELRHLSDTRKQHLKVRFRRLLLEQRDPAVNSRVGRFNELLRTPGGAGVAVQQGYRRGDVLVPGQTAHGSSRPDYGVRAAGRRRWVDLKGNVLEGRDRAEVLDLARRNQAQARRARANLPKDDTLTIRYDPLSDLDTKRALLAIHFAANSPVNRVDFGTEAWDLARWHRVFGS